MKKLIKGGLVVDGTKKPGYEADVLVENDKIVKIGNIDTTEDMEVIDAKGLVVAPGFIDTHSHSDLQILVDPDGKIFMSLDKQQDMQAVLESMGDEYGIKFTPEQEKRFVLSSTFGVPIRSMQKFLDLPEEQRDKILKNEGIPCDSVDNQFKSWVRNARAANADLRIAIKADASTPYSVIKNVMNSLQDLRENRYNLITSLKVESED